MKFKGKDEIENEKPKVVIWYTLKQYVYVSGHINGIHIPVGLCQPEHSLTFLEPSQVMSSQVTSACARTQTQIPLSRSAIT